MTENEQTIQRINQRAEKVQAELQALERYKQDCCERILNNKQEGGTRQ